MRFPDAVECYHDAPRFNPGRCVATREAKQALDDLGVTPASLLDRHVIGDWGDISASDKLANEAAIESGDRILSVYTLSDGQRIWVLTEGTDDEGNRAATTLLLPHQY